MDLLGMKQYLIVTITRKGCTDCIVAASREAGAEGATIVYGRGTGIHEHKKIWGIPIEPEKELVLTIIPEEKLQSVRDAIVKAGELDKPGTGICFVVELKDLVGAVHQRT